jgi:hypothetical protein
VLGKLWDCKFATFSGKVVAAMASEGVEQVRPRRRALSF